MAWVAGVGSTAAWGSPARSVASAAARGRRTSTIFGGGKETSCEQPTQVIAFKRYSPGSTKVEMFSSQIFGFLRLRTPDQ